jgi:hypothetical protein
LSYNENCEREEVIDMKPDRQSIREIHGNLLLKVTGEYARQRAEAGVPLEQYPFFLDEEGMTRLPEDVREKAQAWLSKNRR